MRKLELFKSMLGYPFFRMDYHFWCCMKKGRLGEVASSCILGLVAIMLTGCSYDSDRIAICYEPTHDTKPIQMDEVVNVDLKVRDMRRVKTCVGRKIGSHGEEAAFIKLEKNFKEEVTDVLTAELEKRGFNLGVGNNEVQIDIQRFFNDFKPGDWLATSTAELTLKVTVLRKDGTIAYSKTITGEGTHDKIWAYSGGNAKIPLDEAFNDGIHQLFEDSLFIDAILSKNYVPAPNTKGI